MAQKILITGGAGFVGSHLAAELLAQGYAVRALDNLHAQVHGSQTERPKYLDPEVELMRGDVRDPHAVARALEGVDAVYHLAANVGVGQSMYEIQQYTSGNAMGTAVLLETLCRKGARPIERLVVASSMSIYGEGLYRNASGQMVDPRERSVDQLRAKDWQLRDSDGQPLEPIPTPEDKMPALPSVYAILKYQQERTCMVVGRAYGIPTVGLRFFNIYGPNQALSNPYTGVMAIFAARLLNGKPPLINEDGGQMRDFVHVRDVARACRLALEVPEAEGQVFNVGSGTRSTILCMAEAMAGVLDKPWIEPEVTGLYRMGDIRNCFADISRARRILGYEPQVGLEEGLRGLAQWLDGQTAVDRAADACMELQQRGLSV